MTIGKKKQSLTNTVQTRSIPTTIKSRGNSFLWDQYVQLTQEVASLECEVRPLRARLLRLQNQIMSQNRHPDVSDEELFEDAASENPIFARQKYSTGIIQLQEEKFVLSEQLSQAREEFSMNTVDSLQKQVDEGRSICESFEQQIKEIDAATNDLNTEIDKYRHSKLFDDIQLQKDQLADLSSKLASAKSRNSQLKTEHFVLTDPNSFGIIEDNEDSDEEAKLTRKLNSLRRKNFELCEKFVALRAQQMKEIEAANKVITSQEDDEPKSEVPPLKLQTSGMLVKYSE